MLDRNQQMLEWAPSMYAATISPTCLASSQKDLLLIIGFSGLL